MVCLLADFIMNDLKVFIQTSVRRVSSLVSDNDVDAVINKLIEELGVSTVDDLKEVREQDLAPFIKPIPARKIVAAWSQSGKCYTWITAEHALGLLYKILTSFVVHPA